MKTESNISTKSAINSNVIAIVRKWNVVNINIQHPVQYRMYWIVFYTSPHTIQPSGSGD